MSIITVGIDLAKNVFAVHGVDDNGKAVLVKPNGSSIGSSIRTDHVSLLISSQHFTGVLPCPAVQIGDRL